MCARRAQADFAFALTGAAVLLTRRWHRSPSVTSVALAAAFCLSGNVFTAAYALCRTPTEADEGWQRTSLLQCPPCSTMHAYTGFGSDGFLQELFGCVGPLPARSAWRPARPAPPRPARCACQLHATPTHTPALPRLARRWRLGVFIAALMLPPGLIQVTSLLAAWAGLWLELCVVAARYGWHSPGGCQHAPVPLAWPQLVAAMQLQPWKLWELLLSLLLAPLASCLYHAWPLRLRAAARPAPPSDDRKRGKAAEKPLADEDDGCCSGTGDDSASGSGGAGVKSLSSPAPVAAAAAAAAGGAAAPPGQPATSSLPEAEEAAAPAAQPLLLTRQQARANRLSLAACLDRLQQLDITPNLETLRYQPACRWSLTHAKFGGGLNGGGGAGAAAPAGSNGDGDGMPLSQQAMLMLAQALRQPAAPPQIMSVCVFPGCVHVLAQVRAAFAGCGRCGQAVAQATDVCRPSVCVACACGRRAGPRGHAHPFPAWPRGPGPCCCRWPTATRPPQRTSQPRCRRSCRRA